MHPYRRKDFISKMYVMNLQFEKEVGLRIREIRERQNLTQAEVPARLQVCSRDVTRSAPANIEAGQRLPRR